MLHSDPQNEANKSTIKDLNTQLQTFMDKKEDRCRIQSRTKWMKSGDRMNKFFFSLVKESPMGGLITKLDDQHDTMIMSIANLARGVSTPSYTLP